jgi:hypothetical protein
MPTLRAIVRVASSLAVCTLALTACASDTGDPIAPAATPRFDLITVTTTVAVPAEEFALADENGNQLVCVKQTPTEQLLYKDDEAGTPSQPCPPSYQVVGFGQGIKVDKAWFSEDGNKNGVVCVKFLGNGKEIVKDDNTATPSQPCPPAFNPVGKSGAVKIKLPFDDMVAADDNANGSVCLKTWELTNNFIVHDDNLATPSQPCPPSFAVVQYGGAAPPAEPAEPAK